MSTTEVGKLAEQNVANHFSGLGYRINAKNWRTRWCEIDIIAIKAGIVYFIEVKYRKTAQWGDGLEAITNKKLQQMTFAADMWVQQNGWNGDYRLLVVSVSGSKPSIDKIVEL